MKKSLLVLFGLLMLEACSPADKQSPSPKITPDDNQTQPPENNATPRSKPEDNQKQPPENNATTQSKPKGNQTDITTPKPTTGLAGFLPGKQINIKVSNDAIKLAPRFGSDGTWTNALDPKQHGPYSVEEDGRVILNLPDKSRLTLYIKGESVKSDDMVNLLLDDMLIFSTVESIK